MASDRPPAPSIYHPAFLAAFPDFPSRVLSFIGGQAAAEGGGGNDGQVEEALSGVPETASEAAAAAAIAEERPPSKPHPRKSSSRFIGVSKSLKDERRKTYKAVLTHERKQIFLGYFHTEEEAALAYDRASVELRGPFAKVNFPSSVAQFLGKRSAAAPPTESSLTSQLATPKTKSARSSSGAIERQDLEEGDGDTLSDEEEAGYIL